LLPLFDSVRSLPSDLTAGLQAVNPAPAFDPGSLPALATAIFPDGATAGVPGRWRVSGCTVEAVPARAFAAKCQDKGKMFHGEGKI